METFLLWRGQGDQYEWVREIQDLNYKCLVASLWQPSTSVSEPEWSKNRTLDFSKGIREDIQSKTSEARQVGKMLWESENC